MAEKEWEEDDPMEMVAIELPAQSDAELRDMALCFAEEMVRLGWEEDKLIKVFQSPFYHGPNLVYRQKGEKFVREVIQQAKTMWRIPGGQS